MSSSMFHTFLQFKHDLCQLKIAFAKPYCPCLTTLGQHQIFWAAFSEALDNVDELVSLVLHIMCDTDECCCLENMIAGFDMLFKWSKSLSSVMDRQESLYSMVENQSLINYFKSCASKTHQVKNDLLCILERCDLPHTNLIHKYSSCAMEE